MSNPGGGDFPVGKVADPSDPLRNLSVIRTRMDSLHRFLSETVRTNTLIGKDQMAMVSSEISSAIHQIILNGAALLAASIPAPSPTPFAVAAEEKREGEEEEEEDEVVEIDAVELLAEHVHICDVCGKGFKRDANLRMHMRAHGDRFKTSQALAKPGGGGVVVSRRRFSCPYEGCNRNRRHGKFRALKSIVCLRNHFKRSHCPKMYACERCNGKSFAVAADLRSHLRHCGRGEAARWRCSCGTTFTRKDKLFGHVALFEGHMPAPAAEEEKEEDEIRRGKETEEEEEGEDDSMDGFFDGLLDELGPVGGEGLGTLQDVLGSPNGGFQVGFYGGCL